MSLSASSELVSFDADEVVDAVRDATSGDVHLCVEYTVEDFNVLYADDLTLSLYADEDAMRNHFEQVHDYVHVDFTEMDLFGDIMRAAGDVRAFVTYMDHATLVRVVTADREGLFLTTDPAAEITPLVQAARRAIE